MHRHTTCFAHPAYIQGGVIQGCKANRFSWCTAFAAAHWAWESGVVQETPGALQVASSSVACVAALALKVRKVTRIVWPESCDQKYWRSDRMPLSSARCASAEMPCGKCQPRQPYKQVTHGRSTYATVWGRGHRPRSVACPVEALLGKPSSNAASAQLLWSGKQVSETRTSARRCSGRCWSWTRATA